MQHQSLADAATQNGHAQHGTSTQALGAREGVLREVKPITASTGQRVRRGVKGIAWRIAAVIPCFGKHKDVELLLRDLGKLDVRGIDLWCVVIDNATPNKPISEVPAPANLRLEHVRMESNTGGAGGFNAGMRRVLRREGLSGEMETPDFVWLLDSDARVHRRCLRELLKTLVKHKRFCAAGSALKDVKTGEIYEIGGRICRIMGAWSPMHWGTHDKRLPIPCDYLAACSLLARRDAIEKTGLMPDIFIHGDDVRWCLEMQKATGKQVCGVPASIAYHPHFLHKFQTWTRYYGCRNSFPSIDLMGLGGAVRCRKAKLEAQRAFGQSIMGLDELAELHIQGLRDALAPKGYERHIDMGRDALLKMYKTQPNSTLADKAREAAKEYGPTATIWAHPLLFTHPIDLSDVREQVRELGVSTRVPPKWRGQDRMRHPIRDAIEAAWRLVTGPTADVAIVPTGWPTGWLRGRTQIEVTPDGFFIRRNRRGERLRKGLSVLARGYWYAWRLRWREATRPELGRVR